MNLSKASIASCRKSRLSREQAIRFVDEQDAVERLLAFVECLGAV